MTSLARAGRAFTRFDYSGHGQSGGAFADGDDLAAGWRKAPPCSNASPRASQIIIGLVDGRLARAPAAPKHTCAVGAAASRIAGLVLIAPAVDMTKALMWDKMKPEVQRQNR